MFQRNIILIILIIGLLSSCGSIPDIHYYMIDYAVESEKEKAPTYQGILGIERFSADPLYDSDRIVYRDSAYEVKFYHYHRWVTLPKDIVTEKAIEQFRDSHLFEEVVQFPRFSNIDYLLRGTIKSFEEWDEQNEWLAHVKLHLELVNREDGSLIWQGIVAKKTKVAEKKPVELVHAISQSLQSCIKQAIQQIDKTLSENQSN